MIKTWLEEEKQASKKKTDSFNYHKRDQTKLWTFVWKNKMGSQGGSIVRKPRFLCLHGFRTSAEIMKIQLHKWPKAVIDRLDLVFLDAPFPCQGKSDVDGIFDPPYYEWFQFNEVQSLLFSLVYSRWSFSWCKNWRWNVLKNYQEFIEYENFENCLEYLEDRMIKLGPFDGLIGFSQVISTFW